MTEQIITPDSPEAATYRKDIGGWVNLQRREWTDEPCVYSHLLENWFFSKEELLEAAFDSKFDFPLTSLEYLRCVLPDRVEIQQISASDLLEDYQDADCNIEVTDELQKAVDAVNAELRKIADQNPLYHSYGGVAVDWSNEESSETPSDLTAETMAKSDRGEDVTER